MQLRYVIALLFGCESFAPATRTLLRAARLRSTPTDTTGIDLAALQEAVLCAEGNCAARTYHVDQLKSTLEAAIGDQLEAQKALDDAKRALRDGEALDARAGVNVARWFARPRGTTATTRGVGGAAMRCVWVTWWK